MTNWFESFESIVVRLSYIGLGLGGCAEVEVEKQIQSRCKIVCNFAIRINMSLRIYLLPTPDERAVDTYGSIEFGEWLL